MAPKKPPAPPPPPKEPEPAPGSISLKRLKLIWLCFGVAILIFGSVAAVIGFLYYQMISTPPDPLEPAFQKLRSSMASSYRRPRLNYQDALKVSEYAVTLKETLDTTEAEYASQKRKYKNLYKKDTKVRSVGSWDAFGRNLYYVSKGRKTWYDAENFCVSRDSHLASILSDEEQKYITSQLRDPAWIGLTDEKEEGVWEWTDGSRLIKEYWFNENPVNTERSRGLEKDCTSIVPSLAGRNWREIHCHELRNWVCKESVEI